MQHVKPYNRFPSEINGEGVCEDFQRSVLQISSEMWQKVVSAPVSRCCYDAIILWERGFEKGNTSII